MDRVEKLPVIAGHVIRHILRAHQLKSGQRPHGGAFLLRQRGLEKGEQFVVQIQFVQLYIVIYAVNNNYYYTTTTNNNYYYYNNKTYYYCVIMDVIHSAQKHEHTRESS